MVSAATLSLLVAKDRSLYKSAVSDNTGTYRFEKVKGGKYVVRVSTVSHAAWFSKQFDLNDALLILLMLLHMQLAIRS